MCHKNIQILFLVLSVLFLTGCNTDNIENPAINDFGEDNFINSIMVALPGTTKAELSDESPEEEPEEEEPQEEWPLINTKDYTLDDLKAFDIKFDENTVIFLSQMTSDIPAFQNDDVTYAYSLIPGTENDPEINWEEGYNFTPSENDEPLEWFKIGNGGTYHGGFSLYALQFPLESEIRQKKDENGNIIYGVMQDQSSFENLVKSDILGAYHSTPSLFSRLRFKLHHLMAYLRIRLYVPVYDEITHTGYMEDAVDHALLSNVTPDFAIEWSANRSSDSQGPAVVSFNGDGDIIMYQHPKPEGQEEHTKGLINYKDFLGKYYDQGIEGDYDKVRIYDFSVLLPLQKGTEDEEGHSSSFLNTEFLNFYLTTNSGALTKYYFSQKFTANTNSDSNESDKSENEDTDNPDNGNGSEDSGNDDVSNTLKIEQEYIQYLQLYVPRIGNKLVFVGAKVNPWSQRATNLVLIPSE